MRTLSRTLILSIVLSACAGAAEVADPKDTVQTVVLLPEDIVVVGEEAIAAGPRISGTLEAAETAVLRAEASGSVVSVGAEIGDKVAKGQVLAKIESQAASSAFTSSRSSVTAADQDVKNAMREVARIQRLSEAGALSPRDLEVAESSLTSAQARLAGARAQQAQSGSQVEGTTVRSPIAGIVSQRAVSEGDIVAPGAPMFTVIEPSSLRLSGAVPATAVKELVPGTPVRFEVQGFEGLTFEGSIERVAPAVDPATRQIPVLVTLPNTEGKLLAGLFAVGRVATEERRGMVVPVSVVDLAGVRPTVVRFEGGKLEKVEVEIGLKDPDSEVVEIRSGVELGDTLIVRGKEDYANGTPAELRQAAVEPAKAEASNTPGTEG